MSKKSKQRKVNSLSHQYKTNPYLYGSTAAKIGETKEEEKKEVDSGASSLIGSGMVISNSITGPKVANTIPAGTGKEFDTVIKRSREVGSVTNMPPVVAREEPVSHKKEVHPVFNHHVKRPEPSSRNNFSFARRGMVFWFNLDETVPKEGKKVISMQGNDYADSLMYGDRPWLVVSCDANNTVSRNVTIVPLTTSLDKYSKSYHVSVYLNGCMNTVLCEHLHTCSYSELGEYLCTVSDTVLDRVEDAIMTHLGIRSVKKLDTELVKDINSLESMIGAIIKSRVEAELKEAELAFKNNVISEAVAGINNQLSVIYKEEIEKSYFSGNVSDRGSDFSKKIEKEVIDGVLSAVSGKESLDVEPVVEEVIPDEVEKEAISEEVVSGSEVRVREEKSKASEVARNKSGQIIWSIEFAEELLSYVSSHTVAESIIYYKDFHWGASEMASAKSYAKKYLLRRGLNPDKYKK